MSTEEVITLLKIKSWHAKRSGANMTLTGVVASDARDRRPVGTTIKITVTDILKPEGEVIVVAKLTDGTYAELA